MPTSYTWHFTRLDAYPTFQTVQNAVFEAHWRLVADDGQGHTADVYGSQRLGPIDANDFISFAELTHAQMQSWVETEMGQDQIDALKGILDANITAQVSPPTVGLAPPWE